MEMHIASVLIGASSLADVTLDLVEKCIPVLEMMLRQILSSIRHVGAVTLSSCCLKVLRVMKGKYPLCPLTNVKLLMISCPIEPYELVCFLEIFPKLEMLVIDWNPDKNYDLLSGNILLNQDIRELIKFDEEIFLKSEAIILKAFLLHLRRNEIDWYVYEASLFRFIEFLLKHATAIEKMAIHKEGNLVEAIDMLMAAQKLQSLQRSFPTVELIFC